MSKFERANLTLSYNYIGEFVVHNCRPNTELSRFYTRSVLAKNTSQYFNVAIYLVIIEHPSMHAWKSVIM